MHGLHLTADLYQCPGGELLTDPQTLRTACLEAVAASGLRPVGELFHRFAPAAGAAAGTPVGITGVVLLTESHLAVHTWPEQGAATLDIYVCNFGVDNSQRASALLDGMLKAFAPGDLRRASWRRGGDAPDAAGAAVIGRAVAAP